MRPTLKESYAMFRIEASELTVSEHDTIQGVVFGFKHLDCELTIALSFTFY